MTARSGETPLPAASPDRFAIVTLVDGSRFGARVYESAVAGAVFVRCAVLATPPFTVDCAPSQIAKMTWCSQEEARAASPPSVVPIELRANDSKTEPPAAPEAPLAPKPASEIAHTSVAPEFVVFVDAQQVWLAISRTQTRVQGAMPAELASELGGEDVEVRAENVVFHIDVEQEGRVRAELDARGVELVPVCSRCGCTEDRRCAGGCAWADAARSICNRCNDSI